MCVVQSFLNIKIVFFNFLYLKDVTDTLGTERGLWLDFKSNNKNK